jgi:CHAT domain-containing protein/tetratricopeptide (TPR) repeat protein
MMARGSPRWRTWRAVLAALLLLACLGTPLSASPGAGAPSLFEAGYPAAAEGPLRDALGEAERRHGPYHPEVAGRLGELGVFLDARGRYGEAEPLLRRALAIREAALGAEHPDVAQSLNDLGRLRRRQRDYAEADALLGRSLEIRGKVLGPDHPGVAESLGNLGTLRRRQDRHAEAEPPLRRALAIRERALGPDHPAVADSLNNLGDLHRVQGRYAEAETLLRRALAITEAALGPDHPETAENLASLAAVYASQGRRTAAEALHARALAVRERAFGPDNRNVANSLESLGHLHLRRGRLALAEAAFRRVLAIRARVLGPDTPDMAGVLLNLGDLALERGDLAEAQASYERGLAIAKRAPSPEPLQIASALAGLGYLHNAAGRHAEARPLLLRSLAIREGALGPDHPALAWHHAELAVLHEREGRFGEAFGAIRRAFDIRTSRAARQARSRGPGPWVDEPGRRHTFRTLVRLGWRWAESEPAQRPRLVDETFRAGQLALATDVEATVSRVAARFAAGDDALARLVRERERLAEEWRRLDSAALWLASRQPGDVDPAAIAGRLRGDLADLGKRLDAADEELGRRFPAYRELTSPEPAGVEEIQGLLAADEALLAYAALGGDVFLWALRRDRAAMFRLDLAPGELEHTVRELRDRVDPGRWPAAGAQPPFDPPVAHRLYARLVPGEAGLLAGARHLLVVPHGPLESLPFSVLVRTPPRPDAPYREVDWLARSLATTTLPSASSLRALRRFAKPSRAAEPFRGVGDPALLGPHGASRGAGPDRPLADPRAIRALPPLPETADELRALARSLGAGEDSVLLRERATETAIKAGALANARVVAFATHAGLAGEPPDRAEPALVLTPPAVASEEDDGQLTASEAARLHLDADLVLLSACNTAAPDGTPGAPGLSGLAKAFIYAGSRALLVSHWQVDSEAARRLTTRMFSELAIDPAVGPSEALRRSMVGLVGDRSRDYFAHPAAWAPFVIVGEGARRTGPTAGDSSEQ